jgi:hypothetical protein
MNKVIYKRNRKHGAVSYMYVFDLFDLFNEALVCSWIFFVANLVNFVLVLPKYHHL